MPAFNKENKISFEELSPSLQALINNKASLADFNALQDQFQVILDKAGGVRISITSKLSDIKNPTNGKEIAIITSDSVVTMYTYLNGNWVKIHAVYA